jgi:arylsulfatase
MNGKVQFKDYAVCLYRNTGINDNKVYWEPQVNASMICNGKFKLNIYHNKDNEGELFDLENDPLEQNNLWNNKQYHMQKEKMLLDLLNWQIKTEVNYSGSKGGEMFPPKSQWLENSPI